MPTVLMQGFIAPNHVDDLRPLLPADWNILSWDSRTDDPADFAALARDADAIVGGSIPGKFWPKTDKLKLFQIPWTGYNFTSPERIAAGIPVCNCFEHESAIAEYILLGMLEWQLGLRKMDERFRAKGWDGSMPGSGHKHGEVKGKTVGIIGYGHIGQAVARRAAAFDMKVIGIRRSRQPTPEPLAWLGTNDRLEELLSESDFVVLACDLNDETRNLMNQERLAMMKPTGVVINVARGEVINESALYEALKSRQIGGAIIDTWYNYNAVDKPEVSPSNQDFKSLDNTILSGHESAMTEAQIARRWQFVADNIKRVVAGQAPENQVFTGTAIAGQPW